RSWSAHRAGRNAEWGDGIARNAEVWNESSGELISWNNAATRSRYVIPEGDQFPARIQSCFEMVITGRTVIVMGHVILARPQQLHCDAGLTGFGAFISNQAGDLRNFNVIFVIKPSAETTTGADQMERDIVVFDTSRNRGVSDRWRLTG